MLSGIGWGVGQLIVWQCNAGSLQCQSNFLPFRRFCSVTNFFSLVVGMGYDGTRIQKKRTASRRQLSSTKKGKNGGGVDLSQVAKFAIWDWVGMGWVCPR